MRVKRPPKNREDFFQAFMQLEGIPDGVQSLNTDSDGRYASYYDISHKHPKQADAIWSVLSTLRESSATRLPMVDLDGNKAKLNQTFQIGKIISLVDRVTTSSAIQEILSGLFSDPRLMSDLLNEEPISSSQLEGAATTTRVALEMLESNRKPANESEMMIARNRDMMIFIRQSDILSQDLTGDLIRRVHERATQAISNEHYRPGLMRQSNDVNVQDVRTGEVIFHPPNFGELPDRISELCDWVNTPHHTLNGSEYIHPLIKACVLHFMIGWLHPFNDGNGRTARGLFYWMMMKYGYTGFEYISISKYLKNSPVAYGTAYLNCEYDRFDLTYFIDYSLRQIQLAISEFADYIKKQREIFEYLTSGFVGSERFGTLNERQRKIVISGLMRGGRCYSAGLISRLYNVAFNTAKSDLEAIADNDFFKESNIGKQKMYFTPKSLKQLEEWQQPPEAANRPKATDW